MTQDLDLSVAEVRRTLAKIRKQWKQHSAIQPFIPSHSITDDLLISDFSFRFILAHHNKRHHRTMEGA